MLRSLARRVALFDTEGVKGTRALLNVSEEIGKLKAQPGGDIAIFGSNDLCASLMQSELVDEFRTMVNPVILGHGNLLFKGIKNRLKLRLLRTRTFKSGNVLFYYQPIRLEAPSRN
jgi:dihydrofolate reductase